MESIWSDHADDLVAPVSAELGHMTDASKLKYCYGHKSNLSPGTRTPPRRPYRRLSCPGSSRCGQKSAVSSRVDQSPKSRSRHRKAMLCQEYTSSIQTFLSSTTPQSPFPHHLARPLLPRKCEACSRDFPNCHQRTTTIRPP